MIRYIARKHVKRLLAALAVLVVGEMVSGCGPTLKDVRITIELPPGIVVAEGQKVAPVQINIGNRETHVDTARGLSATIPASTLATGGL